MSTNQSKILLYSERIIKYLLLFEYCFVQTLGFYHTKNILGFATRLDISAPSQSLHNNAALFRVSLSIFASPFYVGGGEVNENKLL
jgi:hypothetical protein